MAACKSCGAEMIWATSLTTGKAVPLNAKPDPGGNLVLLVGGKTRGVTDEDIESGRPRHTSHFVDCPQRREWRKR